MNWQRTTALIGATFVTLVLAISALLAPSIAAGGLLHPSRRHLTTPIPGNCENVLFKGVDVDLKGWKCSGKGGNRGTIVYLHGVADNRASASGVIERFTSKGFDVVAYDSRAHGESEGQTCTYGYLEKQDLRRVIDTLGVPSVVLIGTSLGAAIALQAAADDARIALVVAAEAFSDLRTIARERAPYFLTGWFLRQSFSVAEHRGRFEVDRVSPVTAAGRIKVPVLLIHGDNDRETTPDHSQRVLDALGGPKRLLLVKGAGHNESLRSSGVWEEIDRWVVSR